MLFRCWYRGCLRVLSDINPPCAQKMRAPKMPFRDEIGFRCHAQIFQKFFSSSLSSFFFFFFSICWYHVTPIWCFQISPSLRYWYRLHRCDAFFDFQQAVSRHGRCRFFIDILRFSTWYFSSQSCQALFLILLPELRVTFFLIVSCSSFRHFRSSSLRCRWCFSRRYAAAPSSSRVDFDKEFFAASSSLQALTILYAPLSRPPPHAIFATSQPI